MSRVLLVSAGLLIRALGNLQETDPGFRADGVLTSLPMPKYDSVDRRVPFCQPVLSQVSGLPGVTGAGYISFLPMTVLQGDPAVSISELLRVIAGYRPASGGQVALEPWGLTIIEEN